MIDRLSARIDALQQLIEEDEKNGRRDRALERFKDLKVLILLRATYKEALDRGLV